MQAYCFKCRKKVEIKNAERVLLKNSKPATGVFARVVEVKYSGLVPAN